MSQPADRLSKLKVFPVFALLDYERELLVKAVEGYLLGKAEKAQLEKLLKRMRKETQG